MPIRNRSIKKGDSSIMYDDHLYDLTAKEYDELEGRLSELDLLDPNDREHGFEWIIYKFLTDKGDYVKPPTSVEPRPVFKVNQIREWDDPLEGEKTVEDYKHDLSRRAQPKIPVYTPYDEATTIGTFTDDPFLIDPRARGYRKPKKGGDSRPLRSSRVQKPSTNGGGAIGIIFMVLMAMAAASNECSNIPYAKDGKLVRPDGTVVPENPWKYNGGSQPSVKTGNETGLMLDPLRNSKKSSLPKPSPFPTVPEVIPVPDQEKRKHPTSTPSPAVDGKREKPSTVIPKGKLLEVEKTKLTEND